MTKPIDFIDRKLMAEAILGHAELPSAGARVGSVMLLKCINEETLQCNPSYAELGRLAGLKRRATVVDAVRALRDAGWITIEERPSKSNQVNFVWERLSPELRSTENGGSRVRKTGSPKNRGEGVRFSPKGVRSESPKSRQHKVKFSEHGKNTVPLTGTGYNPTWPPSPNGSAAAGNPGDNGGLQS